MRMRNNILKSLFKITITKKIILIYVALLFLTLIVTLISSYFFFQKLIDDKINLVDLDTKTIRMKLEKLYEKKIKVFELPDLNESDKKKKDDSSLLLEPLQKDYPDYNFKIETVEGVIQYQEKPKLVYDYKEGSYFFEIERQIEFAENLPFKNLKLSIKFNYYQIILKSLLFGVLITIFICFPLIILFSQTIIRPIIRLSKGAREIAGGNLGIKVKTRAKDELGDLATSFNFMSKELDKMKRIRDDLLAVVSHELRSPLGRIKGYTEILNDLKLNKKDKDVYFNSILGEIDFLNYMVGEIIEISRLELNKEQLFLEIINLSDLIEEIKNELNLSIPLNKNIKYEFYYDKELICEVDVEKFKRVLINIFENSVKAGATEVYLYATKESNEIKIKIMDNGSGIPEDQLELVFEKFYRVDKSRDRNTGGFGLGLAICRGIIKEHKGEIYFVKNDNGAELHINIPIYDIKL